MNDYEEQLGAGTPDELSLEEQAMIDEVGERSDMLSSMVEQQPTAEQPLAPAPQVTAEEQVPQEPTGSPFIGEDGSVDIDKIRRYGTERDMDALIGLQDAGIGLLNLIPGVDIPTAPKFENEVAQSVREISSIILPTLTLGGVGVAGASKFAQGSKFLNDPLIKFIGTTSMNAGAGALVDYSVEINQEDDNLAGSLKKAWPRWTGWIPEDIATLDGDSPETKRYKNVLEGAYLGVAADLLGGLSKFARGLFGFQKGAPIPSTEKASNYFKKNVEIEGDVEDVIEASAAKRSGSLDEIGQYNLSKATNLDEPVYGYHDVYGYQEVATRSVDDLGIVGASIDAARIDNNIDTIYGRVGNSVSEGALKYSLENVDNQLMIQKGLADELTAADLYGYTTANGKVVTPEMIQDSGERLAAQYYGMDVDQLRAKLGVVVDDNNTSVLSDAAYQGVTSTLKKYMDDFVNMDYMKAQAYVGTSMAGQISDTAQGMRLTEGTPAIERAQEQILDRMEFLMVQKDMTEFTTKQSDRIFGIINRLGSTVGESLSIKKANALADQVRGSKNEAAAALEEIKTRAKFTTDNLREISRTQPEMLRPLMLAYEMTDGNVDTIAKMNRYLQESTGVLKKSFIDGNPEIPSVVLKAFWSNVYNATLSAFGTLGKASLSTAHLLIEKPLRTMAGGLLAGDMHTVRRGWYQYSASFSALQESLGHMKQVFKRAGVDPTVIATREDYGIPNDQLRLINEFADAKAAQGDYGPQVMAEMVNNMQAMAEHPWLRFGTRGMQAVDGFTQAMVANSEARARAFDVVTKGGRLPFDEVKGNALAKDVKSKMFDETGLIKDEAVKRTAGEISMNLDTEFTDGLSTLIRRAPILRPFLLFTKTPLNELKMSASYTPLGLFMKDVRSFVLPYEAMAKDDVAAMLTQRGHDLSSIDVEATYKEIRADIIGRQAMGAVMVTGATGLAMNGLMTGNGLYDKQKQRLRNDADWKPRSIRLPNGDWVSYDNLGPITTWLSLTADVVDNFDTLAPNDIATQLRKLGFVLASGFKDKTALAGIESLMDVLTLNPGALSKWSSGFLTSALVPGSSQLSEIARLMDPGLKEVDMELTQLMQNRLPFTKGALPSKYDWIDGGEVGVPDNFFARVWNVYMPWKVNGKISDEKQFLQDVEFDARPSLRTLDGIEITAEQRSEILDQMGKDRLFQGGIRRVMNRLPGGAEGFRKRYKEAIDQGLDVDLSTFENIHVMLDQELNRAMRMARAAAPSNSEITRKRIIQEVTGRYLRSGNQSEATRFLDYMEQFSR